MREERLTERLRSWEKDPTRRESRDSSRMINSVVRHLERILNTRWGSTQIAEDFGIPDFTELRAEIPDTLRALERTIQGTIQKYEPRLTSVRVKFVPLEEDKLKLGFQIVGQLVLDDKKDPIIFESYMDTDGKVSIRS